MLIEYIEHEGVVVESLPERSQLLVKISDLEFCPECPGKKLCAAAGKKSEPVYVSVRNAGKYRKGESVNVIAMERIAPVWMRGLTVAVSLAVIIVMLLLYLSSHNLLSALAGAAIVMMAGFALLWLLRGSLPHEMYFCMSENSAGS